MEKKAKFIRALKKNPLDRHAWEHTELLYEYRGHEYIVTKHNNGYAFDGLAKQHKEAQEDIDRRIEESKKPIPEWQYEGSADQAFDMFWEYINSPDN